MPITARSLPLAARPALHRRPGVPPEGYVHSMDMIVRIWRTAIRPEQIDAYEEFAGSVSLPMFREQPGCRGVMFARRSSECVVITLWENMDAVTALTRSPSYQSTVSAIEATGFLVGSATTDVLQTHGGFLNLDE